MSDQSQSGYDSGYESDPSRPTTPVNGQSQTISPYVSYPGSNSSPHSIPSANSSLYSIPSANSSMYSIPYGAGYNPYPMNSTTTSMGTSYGDAAGAMPTAKALNEHMEGQVKAYDDTSHINHGNERFEQNQDLRKEGTDAAETAGAVALVAGAGGIAAGSLSHTKMKNGKAVMKNGEEVKKTSKTKWGIIAGFAGAGLGAAYSFMNRN